MSAVNVNLEKCTCGGPWKGGTHAKDCPGKPILVPLPVQRSVTFHVVLGECDCSPRRDLLPGGGVHLNHAPSCASHPVKVSCSISGSTWEESEVVDAELPREDGGTLFTAYHGDLAPLRSRWPIVKALVLGKSALDVMTAGGWQNVDRLLAQRDAVFAAIANAHMAEDALIEALGDYEEAMRGEPVGIYGLKRESEGAAARYVDRLIEQVGVPGT